eukprot:1548682-Karenia_brevis.AAC.1
MEPELFLKYLKPNGTSPNFEQQICLQGAWSILCQAKLTEDPVMSVKYVLLSVRSTMPYESEHGIAEWDIKSQTSEVFEKLLEEMHHYPYFVEIE